MGMRVPRLVDWILPQGGLADDTPEEWSDAPEIERPAQCDWAWRPDPWLHQMDRAALAGIEGGARLAPGVQLFHDCPLAEITLHQRRRARVRGATPFALELDVLGFQGSFLSMAVDLPEDGAQSLQRHHIICLSVHLSWERPTGSLARLNVRQGPNTEQLSSELRPGARPDSPLTAEFDLGFSDIKPAKLEKAWIDLIFDRPAMNLARIADLTVTRRPRAEI